METKNSVSSRKTIVAILIVIGVLLMLLLAFVMDRVLGTSRTATDRPTERITAVTDMVDDQTQPAQAEQTAEPATQVQEPQQQAQQQEQQPQAQEQPQPQPKAAEPGGNVISAEKAKSIALADAGLKESQVTISKIKYEWDDGIQIYDVEFYQGYMEYEYEINATTGVIIEKDMGYDD